MRIKEKYVNLSEWAKWVLCWPISIVGAFVAVLLISLLWIIRGDVRDNNFLYVINAGLYQGLVLYFISKTAPKKPHVCALVLAGIRSVFFLIIFSTLIFNGIFYIRGFEISWESGYWRELIGETIALIVSIFVIRYIWPKKSSMEVEGNTR